MLKQIKKSKKIFFVIFSIIIFYVILYYILFMPKDTEDSTASLGVVSADDATYQEYRDYVSDTNKGIKNLLEGDQLRQIKPYDYPDFTLDVSEVPRADNPFAESF